MGYALVMHSCDSIVTALATRHETDPIFVTNKRDFLNLFTESDVVVATMAGQIIEYEVKVSRADFFRDAQKLRNKIYAGDPRRLGRRPNRFFYATPPGLLTPAELPSFAGLVECDPSTNQVVLRHPAPRLTRECLGVDVLMRLARAMRDRHRRSPASSASQLTSPPK